jgi:hypothetical protein
MPSFMTRYRYFSDREGDSRWLWVSAHREPFCGKETAPNIAAAG